MKMILFFSFLMVFAVQVSAADDWRPISKEELTMSKGQVDADAAAEILFWEARIVRTRPIGLKTSFYIRTKIFSALGREEFSKVTISKSRYTKIKNLKARVVQPDGSIEEVSKDAFFEQVVAKNRWTSLKQLSFVFPNVKPGAIIEYQYDSNEPNSFFFPPAFELQRELPVQLMRYILKPNQSRPFTIRLDNTNTPWDQPPKKGEQEVEIRNIPARSEEDFMPPDWTMKWRLIMDYDVDKKSPDEEVFPTSESWKQIAVRAIRSFRLTDVYPSAPALRGNALEIVGDAKTDREKLGRLYDFCANEIVNLDLDKTLKPTERVKLRAKSAKVDSADSAMKTFETKKAFSIEVDELFASLALSLGFGVRYALTGDQRTVPLSTIADKPMFPVFFGIAVKLGDEWLYFAPSDPNSSAGELPWYREDQDAILIDDKSMVWSKTPVASPDYSVGRSEGALKIGEDNSIKGHLVLTYSGHLKAVVMKELAEFPEEEHPQFVASLIHTSLPQAKVSNVKIQDLKEPGKPLKFELDVSASNYGSTTGSRLIFEPNIFTHGTRELFQSTDRKNDIFFSFAWTENDEIMFEVPSGYDFEANIKEEPILSTYFGISNAAETSVQGNKLMYSRTTKIGMDGKRRFSYGKYPELRELFGRIHNVNTASVLYLKRKNQSDW